MILITYNTILTQNCTQKHMHLFSNVLPVFAIYKSPLFTYFNNLSQTSKHVVYSALATCIDM